MEMRDSHVRLGAPMLGVFVEASFEETPLDRSSGPKLSANGW